LDKEPVLFKRARQRKKVDLKGLRETLEEAIGKELKNSRREEEKL